MPQSVSGKVFGPGVEKDMFAKIQIMGPCVSPIYVCFLGQRNQVRMSFCEQMSNLAIKGT